MAGCWFFALLRWPEIYLFIVCANVKQCRVMDLSACRTCGIIRLIVGREMPNLSPVSCWNVPVDLSMCRGAIAVLFVLSKSEMNCWWINRQWEWSRLSHSSLSAEFPSVLNSMLLLKAAWVKSLPKTSSQSIFKCLQVPFVWLSVTCLHSVVSSTATITINDYVDLKWNTSSS